MVNPSQVILLVEDRRQQQLISRYLRRLGLWHATRAVPVPAGRGSGAQWVLKQFPIEVARYRSRANRAATKLVVFIDADTHTVHARLRQLEQALKEADVPRIEEADQIVRLIPKRNIETWILCLNLERVDEETDYKRQHRDWAAMIPPAADTLHQWGRPNAAIPPTCVESLRSGIAELKNIER